MTTKKFKYEVAFSFLKEDENLANQINDLIQDRLSTFIYSKHQNELVGTDGEETFNKVFGSEARIVVVLYREGWGKSPWTRIEKIAIKNRAYTEGYNYTIFIVLDKNLTMPKWLPHTIIWYDLDRLGIKGASAIIERKVQEFDGFIREETVLGRAAERLNKQFKTQKRIHAFLNSPDTPKKANDEIDSLFSQLKQKVNMWKEQKDLSFNIDYNEHRCIVIFKGFTINYYSEYRRRSFEDASLNIKIFDGILSLKNNSGYFPGDEPQELYAEKFNFYLSELKQYGWTKTNRKGDFYTTKKLMEISLTKLLDIISKKNIEKVI